METLCIIKTTINSVIILKGIYSGKMICGSCNRLHALKHEKETTVTPVLVKECA